MSSCCSCTTFQFDLCIKQWATYLQDFTWLSPQITPKGSQILPVDLTGYQATLQISPYPLSGIVLYDASPNITLGGPTGIISINIPADTTGAFTWWAGVYDLLLISPDGTTTYRFAQGNATVSPGVST